MSRAEIRNPPAPQVRLSLGITGHRAGHRCFADNERAISAALEQIFGLVDAAVKSAPAITLLGPFAPTRLHSLLADGTDRTASYLALSRGYELVAPLPFGRRLNRAINALTINPAEARQLLGGEDGLDPSTQAHASAIRDLSDKAHVFGLADADERIAALFLASLDDPLDHAAAALFSAESSRRVALAGRVLIEQSDLLLAVWDGGTTGFVGGTGHTILTALDLGTPVVWIDPAAPADWRILNSPEALATIGKPADRSDRAVRLAAIVHAALDPGAEPCQPGFTALDAERWHDNSNRLTHAYRRIEALFDGGLASGRLRSLRQHYERPDAIAQGSAAGFLNGAAMLPHADMGLNERIMQQVFRRFAWADGVSARLSDAYRGGMTISFILSSLSIVGGVAYLPFVGLERKWLFALTELGLLLGVVLITWFGQRRNLHTRWFQTRRVAEYLRHSPLLLILGAARPAGKWPRGADAGWPEFYARHVLRSVGLPRMAISQPYLRGVLNGALADHVREQRNYHAAKARRLAAVHHRLDRLSGRLFQLAVAAVALYLVLRGLEVQHIVSDTVVAGSSKYFTVLGVLFPTFGAGIAGLRYFGDFERFGEISEVTAEKLTAIAQRIDVLAQAPDGALTYGDLAELVHATDDVVVAEIESWQAVFSGKHIAVPV